MPGCAAVGCNNRSEKGYIMKCFPRDAKLRKLWQERVGRADWEPSNNSFLCHVHFKPQEWSITHSGRIKLKKGAVPSIFTITSTRKSPKKRMKLSDIKKDDTQNEFHLDNCENDTEGSSACNLESKDYDYRNFHDVFTESSNMETLDHNTGIDDIVISEKYDPRLSYQVLDINSQENEKQKNDMSNLGVKDDKTIIENLYINSEYIYDTNMKRVRKPETVDTFNDSYDEIEEKLKLICHEEPMLSKDSIYKSSFNKKISNNSEKGNKPSNIGADTFTTASNNKLVKKDISQILIDKRENVEIIFGTESGDEKIKLSHISPNSNVKEHNVSPDNIEDRFSKDEIHDIPNMRAAMKRKRRTREEIMRSIQKSIGSDTENEFHSNSDEMSMSEVFLSKVENNISKTASQKKSSKKMAETEELENMVLSFRVSELQMLLGFAGRNKSGRKNELQARALELLHIRSHPVQLKIRELYKTIQADQLVAHQMYGQTGSSSEPQIDQNMHSRNYYTRQAMGQQQAAQSSVGSGKELTPAHQASLPQPARLPVYQSSGYTNVTPQRTTNTGYNPYPFSQKVLPPPLPIQPSQYPVHPDVRLKKLPFFDMMAELLKPSSLMPQGSMRLQENSFLFHLTPQQSTDIASSRDCRSGSKMDYTVQVQMRFCLQETSCEQEDYFPPNISVKVNGKMCPLPNPIPTNKQGVEPKRPSRPVNISPLVKLSPTVANQINVTWSADYSRRFAIAVYLVRKLTSAELLVRLKNKGARHSDYTRGLIKEKLNEDADSEIATTSLRVSLACPLGKMRMSTPCRATTCSHLQCFDASLFLQMNERKPTWSCPVCDKPALYDNLVIDGYFQEVLYSSKLIHDVNEIQLLQDGSWENLVLKKEKDKDKDKDKNEAKAAINNQDHKIDVDTVDLDESNPIPTREKKRTVVIDLISDSDDDEEDSMSSHSTKKLAMGISSTPKKTQPNSITSTSDSPELMIIDLE